MKIGFVVHFFDFRNDVRRLITEVSKTHDVVLFTKQDLLKAIQAHPIPNVEVRVIEERIPSIYNQILERSFLIFRKLPKSRQNFYLMECFKLSNAEKERKKRIGQFYLSLTMKLPKVLGYDKYLSKLQYSGKTKCEDIDQMIFFTEISDDYFLGRCIKEKKNTKIYAYSWDHAFKHTRFSNKVNYLTWSEATKTDICELQNVNSEKIKVWGASQLSYVHEAKLRKLDYRTYPFQYIYYVSAIGIKALVSQEIHIIKLINKIISENSNSLKLVVRPYPQLYNWGVYDELKNLGIIFDDDFKTKDLSIGEKSIQEKYEKILNAELLLHLGTTMGLEASFFDTPSLLIDFGYNKNTKDLLHVKHFIHQGQNDKYLADANPLHYLKTETDLIQWIKWVENGESKSRSQNHLISGNFSLDSFEDLAIKLTKL